MDTGPLGLSCGIWHLRIESGSLQILWVAERESVDTFVPVHSTDAWLDVDPDCFGVQVHALASLTCSSSCFWAVFAIWLAHPLAGRRHCFLVISVSLQHFSEWIRSNWNPNDCKGFLGEKYTATRWSMLVASLLTGSSAYILCPSQQGAIWSSCNTDNMRIQHTVKSDWRQCSAYTGFYYLP